MANATTPVIQINEGYVGIGTSTPSAKLDVRGSAGGYLKFDTTGSNSTIKSDYNLQLYADDTGDNSSPFANMQFFTAGANERMRINAAGNVGIGTTNPGADLHVNSVNAQGTLIIGRTGSNLAVSTGLGVITFPADYNSSPTNYAQIRAYSNALSALRGSLDFNVKSTSGTLLTGMSIYGTSAGVNLGIGTTSPASLLSLQKDDSTVYDPTSDDGQRAVGPTILLNNNSTTTNTFGQIMYDTDSSGQGVARIVFLDAGTASSAIAFVTEQSDSIGERMRIDSAGNVGIGTDDPAAKLFVDGKDASNNSSLMTRLDTTYAMGISNEWVSTYVSKLQLGRVGIGNNSNIDFIYDIAGTEYGSIKRNYTASSLKFERGTTLDMIINGSGNVGIGMTSPAVPLDVEGTIRSTNDNSGSYLEMFNDGDVSGNSFIKSTSGELIIESAADITFSPNSTEKLRITSTGDIELAPSSRIVLDDQPTASTASGSGTIVKWSVSAATTVGLMYILKFDGTWTATDADSEVKSTGMAAIALGTNANLGMLLQGFFYKSAHGFTIGLPLYISNTAGALTTTRPTGTNDYVRIIGYATSANYIYFDPDKTWVQVA